MGKNIFQLVLDCFTLPQYVIFLQSYLFTPCKAEQPLRGRKLQEKEAQKD